jgi:lysophospholipase L1-like esterase
VNPLLFPAVAAQGLRVRRTTEVIAPAAGPTTGTVTTGSGSPLRLAVLGESTAAGCGADTHDTGFTGHLARELAELTRRPVDWQVVGQYGATARDIRHDLLPQLSSELDVAVLLAGANDVLHRTKASRWAENLAAVIDGLAARQIVVSGIPPFEVFPALPPLLARYLAERANRLDAMSRRVCAARSHVTWLDLADLLPRRADYFASDRFHPSASGYQLWATAVADQFTAGAPV